MYSAQDTSGLCLAEDDRNGVCWLSLVACTKEEGEESVGTLTAATLWSWRHWHGIRTSGSHAERAEYNGRQRRGIGQRCAQMVRGRSKWQALIPGGEMKCPRAERLLTEVG